MIIYWVLNFIFTIISFIFSLFPVIETPLWLTTNLPQIFRMVFAFNNYLPVYESWIAVLFLINFTISVKISGSLMKLFGVDFN